MKIRVVGAAISGLTFASAMRRFAPGTQVERYERDLSATSSIRVAQCSPTTLHHESSATAISLRRLSDGQHLYSDGDQETAYGPAASSGWAWLGGHLPLRIKSVKQGALVFILAFIWLIGGCRPVATPGPSVPAFTPTLQAAEPTLPAMTATFTPRPTATATPTEIPEMPTATPDMAATVVAISQPRIYSSLLSPDGEWQAEVVIYDCVPVGGVDKNGYEQLKLIQMGGGAAKIADSQLQSCGGSGAFGLAGLFWSPNSRYFYYTDAREGVPDGCGYWERPIIRLDVSDLRLEYLGSGPRSPDGTKLATWQGQELVVWDIDEGEIARISTTASDAETGPIAWSPDSQALVYVQFASYCPLSGKSYVVRLDLSELKQTLLLESETPTFGHTTWDVPNELRLFDEKGKEWLYDLATQELEQAP